MGMGKKPDPRKRKLAHAHSSYLEVENGKKCGGWKAGEIYGVYCHHAGRTKPCLDNITDGALECDLCRAGLDQVFRAYLPLWDREYQLRHVLIGEEFYEAVDRIPFRHPLTLSRALSSRAPLKASDEPFFTRELPACAPWDKPVSMLPICLTLWKIENLTRWMMIDKTPTGGGADVTPLKSDGKPFSRMTAAAARRFAPPATKEEPALIGDPVKKLMQHANEVISNGAEKPKSR